MNEFCLFPGVNPILPQEALDCSVIIPFTVRRTANASWKSKRQLLICIFEKYIDEMFDVVLTKETDDEFIFDIYVEKQAEEKVRECLEQLTTLLD